MFKFSELRLSFDLLYRLYQPAELILVGTDATFWVEVTKEIAFNKVSFVDADKRKIRELKTMVSLPHNWTVFNSLVYGEEEDVTFYELNNSKLNGMVPPETLQLLWRNIHEKSHRLMLSKRLEDVLDTKEETYSTKCMVIECFGALSILEGAESLLDTTDIVFAKSTLSDNDLLKGISQQKLNFWLKERGFKNIGFVEDNHPEVGLFVYVKDVKKELSNLNLTFQIKIEESEKLDKEQATLKKEKQKIVEELETEKTKVLSVQKEKEELSKRLQNKNYEVEQLKNEITVKREESGKLAKEKAKLKEERQKVVEELETEKTKVLIVQKEKEELSKILQNKNHEVEQLKNEITIKREESEKLAKEKSILKEEKQKIVEELETEKTKALIVQKEKEKLSKILQNKNSEVEQLQKEIKIKTEEEKQNISSLKKELDILNTTLQTKIQESDKLRNEQENIKKENEILKIQVEVKIKQDGLQLNEAYLNSLSKEEKIKTIVTHCINQNDILEAIDSFILGNSLKQEEKFEVCCEFALQISRNGDRIQGVSFINNAKYFLAQDKKNKEQYLKLINISIKLNQLDLTIDLEMEYNEKYGHYSPEVNKKISEKYKKIRSVSQKKQQHGHDLLIDYIEEHIKDGAENGKVMVEIGTTRENIPGQGSTLELAKLCKKKGIKFITVDMDGHNTRWAKFISDKYNLDIEAITQKGEVFLKKNIDLFDFVFLDAYDFDHGKHSELRQKRYEQNLGNRIDEEESHTMHLKCAKSVFKKLKKDGVVCVDDTWKDENGNWTAKGTLAVPYLLKKGFVVLSKRNNAILMKV